MNEEIINERWKYTRNELNDFQLWYKNRNKKTQDKIQDIVNYYNITFNDLTKTISKSDKERLKRKIEGWKELGIYKGYFKYHIEELIKKNNYKALIEALIYGSFAEEENELLNGINALFSNVALDNYNRGRKDLGYKKVSKVPKIILETVYTTLIDGILFMDYLNALYLTNMQEINKEYLINLQQNKKLDVYSNFLNRKFEKQRNRLICVNEDKYSGGLDKYVTSLGNDAYIEASGTDNAKVKFVSDHCEHTTKMCEYMDGMVFNTRDRNIFKRPYGETQDTLEITDFDIMGLVLGINKPPITNHFHWCHSVLTYQIDKSADEIRNMIKDNWLKSLTNDEYRDLLEYISSGSYKINDKLRNNINLTEEELSFQNNLDSALKYAPKYEGTVYRSVYVNTSEDVYEVLKPFNNSQKIGGWSSYISTSKGIYDEDMKLQFKIKSLTGRDLSKLNDEGYGEILFERNAMFKLIEIEQKNGKIFVELEELK